MPVLQNSIFETEIDLESVLERLADPDLAEAMVDVDGSAPYKTITDARDALACRVKILMEMIHEHGSIVTFEELPLTAYLLGAQEQEELFLYHGDDAGRGIVEDMAAANGDDEERRGLLEAKTVIAHAINRIGKWMAVEAKNVIDHLEMEVAESVFELSKSDEQISQEIAKSFDHAFDASDILKVVQVLRA